MRKSKVKPLVANYAVSLRKEGKKYSEIVELCAQIDPTQSITLDWCKKELKTVKIETVDLIELTCLDQITQLALLPKGISYPECRKIIIHNHKIDDEISVYELYKKYKAKIQKIEGTFFRPSSLQPNRATQSFKELLQYANVLYDSIADYVCDYCRDNQEVYPDSVRRELANLLFPELKINGGAMVRCRYLEKAVNTLCERVKQQDGNAVEYYDESDVVIDENELPY